MLLGRWDNKIGLWSWQDSLDSSCACVLSGILGISLKTTTTKNMSVWEKGRVREKMGSFWTPSADYTALMTTSTKLVFIHPAAPSAAQSRSHIGFDKAKVLLFLPTINSFENNCQTECKWGGRLSFCQVMFSPNQGWANSARGSEEQMWNLLLHIMEKSYYEQCSNDVAWTSLKI